MELWCKSKRWINTIVFNISAFERAANIRLSTEVEGQMLDFPLDS